jgi:hypothetical protein
MLNGALPPFDLDSGTAVIVLRGLTAAALLWVFGACLFVRLVAPRSYERMPAETAAAIGRLLSDQILGGLVCAAVALMCWLVAQAASFADASQT